MQKLRKDCYPNVTVKTTGSKISAIVKDAHGKFYVRINNVLYGKSDGGFNGYRRLGDAERAYKEHQKNKK